MLPSARRLLHSACSLLVILGLVSSMVETLTCMQEEGRALATASSSPVLASAGGGDQPAPFAPRGIPCCPCIHSFPTGLTVAFAPRPAVVGFATAFTLASRAHTERHPQPLVPPPIV